MADKIRTLGPGSLVIGAADDQRRLDVDCTSVELAPDNSSEDPDTYLDGHEEGGELTSTWKLSGSIGEDYSMEGAQVWCLNHAGVEIEKDPQTAYDYTAKGNLVAVISNGTAVLASRICSRAS